MLWSYYLVQVWPFQVFGTNYEAISKNSAFQKGVQKLIFFFQISLF